MSDAGTAAVLMGYLELEYFDEGEYLIRQGAESTDLFFVESGRVAVQLESTGQSPVRVRSMGAGTVVGEVALYLGVPRSASVIAELPSVVYRLTLDAMERMKKQDPEVAASFHVLIVRLVAGRLMATNKLVQALHR